MSTEYECNCAAVHERHSLDAIDYTSITKHTSPKGRSWYEWRRDDGYLFCVNGPSFHHLWNRDGSHSPAADGIEDLEIWDSRVSHRPGDHFRVLVRGIEAGDFREQEDEEGNFTYIFCADGKRLVLDDFYTPDLGKMVDYLLDVTDRP